MTATICPATQPAEALSLRSRAIRATAWIALSKPLGMALQLARSLVLTRLLFPEAFGLMTLVGVVVQGLQMCSDVGLGPSIVKSRRGLEAAFLQTAWTLQIIRGAILWLACCALAWPASIFYHELALRLLLPVAGLGILVSGFETTAWGTQDRAMSRQYTTLVWLAAQVLNLAVLVLVAWWMRSVWALVLGALSGSLISVILGHLYLPGVRHRLHWDPAAARELIHFGIWVFVSTLLTFVAMQFDRLVLGKMVPLSLLGVYSLAQTVTAMPRELVQGIASAVLFPVLAEQVRQSSPEMVRRLHRARGLMLRAGLLLCFGIFAVAPALFAYLYDPRYSAAAWMAQYLALAGWLSILYGCTGYALLAFGDAKSLALGNLVNAIVTAACALLGFHCFRLPGFILGYALGTAAGELAEGLRLRRFGAAVLAQDANFTLIGLAAAALYLLLTSLLGGNACPPWARSATGLSLWAALVAALGPAFLRALRRSRLRPARTTELAADVI